jgi:small subunit ribosomal protein S16
MLRIRLRRVGKKKQPMYRIVVADSRSPRDGAFVEALGYYHPLDNPSTIVIDADRARHWLDRGAQPSDRVAKLLAVQSIAEISPKLKTRIALGEQRAKEAGAKAEAKEAPAPAAAPPAHEAPAAQAAEEAPTAEAEPAPAEAEAAEAPAEDAAAEESAEG